MLFKNARAGSSPLDLTACRQPSRCRELAADSTRLATYASAIGGPGQLIRGNPQDMDDVIKAVATLRRAGLTGKKAALPGRAAPARPAPRAIAPASDDDATQPVDYADIISTLKESLRSEVGVVPVDASDEADEASARAAVKAGRSTDAVDRFSALALKLQAKATATKPLNPLLAEKSQPAACTQAHGLRLQ